MLIKGQLGKDDLAGPVGIVKIVDESYESSKEYGFMSVLITMINLTMLLSANLAVMNILPIPGLDGGRLLFLI
ncbi:site-2 protease family protein, partial [Enterococcus faecium]|uniref:site-2 protease family protein n=1 Tax=Enterococcus faecium TaxID=1352 RepID=UPI0039FC67F8